VGRTVRRKETKKKFFLNALRAADGNITEACAATEIDRSTYYRWIAQSPRFKQAVHDIEEELPDIAEKMLKKNVRKGSQRALEFTLTNRRREKYQDTRHTELTGTDNAPVQVVFVREKEEKPAQGDK